MVRVAALSVLSESDGVVVRGRRLRSCSDADVS